MCCTNRRHIISVQHIFFLIQCKSYLKNYESHISAVLTGGLYGKVDIIGKRGIGIRWLTRTVNGILFVNITKSEVSEYFVEN